MHSLFLVGAIYVAFSVMSFIVYWFDKQAAIQGTPRVRESTLHLLALLGGWPGAYAAQKILRHKTVKQPFQAIFLACVMLNIFGLILYSSPVALAGLMQLVEVIK